MSQIRVNERITSPQVMLILSDGKAYGRVSRREALRIANEENLDLIEVSPGEIPTCKLGDFGKMQYNRNKSERHKSHALAVKEIHIKYNTDEHDINIKRKKIEEFLAKGHRVVFFMDVKGRERYVADNAARQKFEKLVRNCFPHVKPNDIQENGKGFSVTISPP